MSNKLGEICRTNMGLSVALIGFDTAILAILLTRSGLSSWTNEAVAALLAVSIFSLTYSYFAYHAVFAAEQGMTQSPGAEKLLQIVKRANIGAVLGLFTLLLAVPLLLWGASYYIALLISVLGFFWMVYRFIRRRV